MTFEQATQRLLQLAQANGGVVTAEVAERDEELSADPQLASAAARALDGSTNVFGTTRADEDGWFPFDRLEFH